MITTDNNVQVKVYRLISEDSMEERVLARARQKQLLAAEVIKGGGGSNTPNEPDDASKDDELSLNEMWSILQCGAERILDPSTNNCKELSASDYDKILDTAKSGIDLEHFDTAEPCEPATEATVLAGEMLRAPSNAPTTRTIFDLRSEPKAKAHQSGQDCVEVPVQSEQSDQPVQSGGKKLSPYMLFCQAERENVRLKDKDNPLKFGEVAKALGAAWKSASDLEKAKYHAMANSANESDGGVDVECSGGVDVECNGIKAVFLPSERLILTEPGFKITPSEFEASAGLGHRKNWKLTILLAESGEPLKQRLYKSCLGKPEAKVETVVLGKRSRGAPKRFVPPEYRQDVSTKKKLKNFEACFMCRRSAQNADEMISCDQ